MTRFLVIVITLIITEEVRSQDFVFPKDEKPSHLSGNDAVITERIPVYIPGRCGENMLLYPGAGDKSVWSCDCKPGYLYFPVNGTCHEAYRQGPCPTEHYVYLPINEAVPGCVRNPCRIDGSVPWGGTCRELGASCKDHGVLAVNSRTYQVECVPASA